MMLSLRSALLLLLTVPAAADIYNFDPDPLGGAYVLRSEDWRRKMQVTNADCNPFGARMICTQSTTVSSDSTTNPGSAEGTATFDLTVDCELDTISRFNYQRAVDCRCSALVTSSDPDIPDKTCPCTVCPEGFGNAPVSIDCDSEENQEARILSTCTSFDCGLACNGTCSFGCEVVGPECTFCENANPPSGAPTGAGGNDIPSLTSASGSLTILWGAAAMIASVMAMLA